MTSVIADYIANLTPKAKGQIRGTARLEIIGHGSVMLHETGATAGNDPADAVLIASDEVFRNILSGAQDQITAYMSGKLKVDGNVQLALKVSAILTD